MFYGLCSSAVVVGNLNEPVGLLTTSFESIKIKSNYWFNVQTFICEDDSDAQKKQISRRMQPQKSSVLSSCLKLTGEVAQRVFADKLFQTTGAECLKARGGIGGIGRY